MDALAKAYNAEITEAREWVANQFSSCRHRLYFSRTDLAKATKIDVDSIGEIENARSQADHEMQVLKNYFCSVPELEISADTKQKLSRLIEIACKTKLRETNNVIKRSKFGKQLYALRMNARLTQEELVEKTGIITDDARQYIDRLERLDLPSPAVTVKLVNFFNLKDKELEKFVTAACPNIKKEWCASFMKHEGHIAFDNEWLQTQDKDKRFGLYLKACRQICDLNQRELEGKVKLPKNAISAIENGVLFLNEKNANKLFNTLKKYNLEHPTKKTFFSLLKTSHEEYLRKCRKLGKNVLPEAVSVHATEPHPSRNEVTI